MANGNGTLVSLGSGEGICGELFEVVSGDVVDLGDVLVSNKHEFSSVEILNKTDEPIRIELSSTVTTLGFQHSNENFGSNDDMGTEQHDLDKHNFNQVFNYVNLIKSFEVRPRQLASIWISYRPNFQARKQETLALEYREVGDIILQARNEEGRTQKSKLKFTCRCCLPLLEVSANELDFGLITSVPNEANTQIQEFTISNNSVIPLDIVIRLSRGGGALNCMVKDYDQNEDLIDKEITLGAHEFKRVQVSVWAKPDTSGDHDMQLRVENRSDQTTRNVLICGTIAHSTSAAKPLTDLELPGGANFIDFGNCYAGEMTTQVMSITNQAIQPVYVQFDHDSTDTRDRVKGKLAVRIHDEQLKEQRDELCEVFLKPGVTEKLDVCYTPDLIFDKKKIHGKRHAGDKLQPVRFRLFVRTAVLKEGEQVPSDDKKHSKGISCRAMVCTSRVEVKEREIDFGDSLLGKTASCHVTIENPTALPAELRIEYDSKIMKAVSGNDVVIKENSAVSLEFQIVPHKVNPSFCKQVYLRNIHNPKDISIINLSSNNIDSMTSTHAQYYSLSFLNKKRDKEEVSTRQIEGVTIEVTPGFPSLRAFRLKNKQDTKLILSLGTSKPQCMGVYIASPSLAKSQLLRTFANEGFLKTLPERDPKSERDYVNNVLKMKQELNDALKNNQLIPVKDLVLSPGGEPESEVVCYVLVRMSGKRSTREESIKISAKNIPDSGERQIPVVLQIYETGLDIGLLTNLNLGHVVVGERSSCIINLSNASHHPLLFEVVKDVQSLQSTQLRIESTKDQRFVGLVRPFARRPLEVTIHPSMRGKLNERLTFVNLLNPETQKILIIKADVSKIATFEVKPAVIDAGTVVLGDRAKDPTRSKDVVRTKFTLINIGKSKREYLISPSSATPLTVGGVTMTVEFDVETVKAQASSRNLEEEIEALEQKIKGHLRKKNEDKALRVKKKLDKLKEMLISGNITSVTDTSDDGGCVSSSDDETGKRDRSVIDGSGKGRFITRPVPVGGTISVGVTIHIKKNVHERIDQLVNLDFTISEARDKETHSTVKTTFRVIDLDVIFNSPNGKHKQPIFDVFHVDPPELEHPPRAFPRFPVRKRPEEIGELVVSTEAIDFGKLPIGKSASHTLELSAHDGDVGYVIVQNKRVGGTGRKDARIEIEPRNGTVSPSKPVRVNVTVTPMCGKLQKYLFDIRNLDDKGCVITVALTVCGIEVAPIVVSPPALDFETIYLATKQPVDRFGSKEAEKKFLRVSIYNQQDTDLDVKLSSTHAAQCGIYTDLNRPEPKHEITSLKLPRWTTTPVYIALYPRLEKEKSIKGICKRIEGAVTISSETGNWRTEIPFKCKVGCVALKAHGPAVVDLGTIRKDRKNKYFSPIKGVFTLENSNKELALEYSISCNDTFLRVDNIEGFIPPNSTIDVGYTLNPHGSGLIQETITFKNRSSSQVQIKRTLLLFVDDQCIRTSVTAEPSGNLVLPLPVGAVTQSQREIPFVETNHIFVNDQSRNRVQFKMENKSGAELWLLPKCDLHGYDANGDYVPCLTVCTKNEEFEANRLVPASNPPHVNARKGVMWSSAGSCVVLPKDRSTTVLVEARCVPCYSNLSSADKRHLKQNRTVTVSCNLCFFVEKAINKSSFFSNPFSHGRAAQLVKVQISICTSHIEFAGPSVLALGRIPKVGRVPFNVHVRNPSQVETTMILTMPPHMYVEPCQTPFQCGFPIESVDPMRLPGLAKPMPYNHANKGPVKRLSGSSPVGLNALTPPSTHMAHRCCSLIVSSSEVLAGTAEAPYHVTYPVPEESEVTLHCFYYPASAEHDERGRIQTEIELTNVCNAANVQKLQVTAVIERSIWSFEGLDTAVENEGPLHLGSLIKITPVAGNDTGRVDAKVVLRCHDDAPATEDDTIQANIELETQQEVADFVSLKVLLLATNVQLPSSSVLTFSPDEPTIGLRVRCTPVPGKCISKTLAEHMWRMLFEDLLRDSETREKEVHMQYESCDNWDNSIADIASPYDVTPSYTVALKLRDIPVKPCQVHLGNLVVESKGHPSSCKEIFGQVTQVPTYNISCHKKLVLYETSRSELEKVFKGTFSVENLLDTELRLLTKPVVRDGYNINVEMPNFAIVNVGEPFTIPITVQVPLTMEDDHLHDSVLLFFQDMDCLISIEVITVSLVKPTIENDDDEHDHALETLSLENLPTSESADQLDVLSEQTLAQGSKVVVEKKKDLRADSPCDDKASAASSLAHSPGKEPREADMLSASGTDILDCVAKVTMSDIPLLRLSNCKASDLSESCRQYSLSLTPGVLDGDNPSAMVTVENISSRTVEVEVDIIKLPNETKWLSVNKTRLKINAHDKQTLVLSASTSNVGSFSTYVLLEVPDVQGESISLKCSGEIQAWGPTAASSFDILIDGKATTPVRPHMYELVLGDVFYGELVAHRCIDIMNNSNTRLEFNMSHTTHEVGGVKVRLEMSLNLHTLRPFQRLTVEPHHTQRVYVWYLATSEGPITGRLETSSEITLKCRMVKDLTKTILVKAKCNEPQMQVSADELNVTATEQEAQLTVTNACDTPVLVELKKFALFAFSITSNPMPITATPFELQPLETMSITVALDVAKIEAFKKQHQKTSFVVEEHFALYNCGVPKEKKYITLRAFIGLPVTKTLASRDVLHTLTTFNRLRDKIFLLIRQFKVFAALKEKELGKMCEWVDEDGAGSEDSSSGVENEAATSLVAAVDSSMEEVQGMYLEFRCLLKNIFCVDP
eukprot:TRINITY_DN1463_c1_g1_i2.p1 TRINITY_DN1463_c1_g1~~TRINITY_DN1463_c1_g1_i2.p1  ORF type:complete len:2750 (+),score=954.52 TRINITY_DN1463_c1_g1_i2:345-8594(+)